MYAAITQTWKEYGNQTQFFWAQDSGTSSSQVNPKLLNSFVNRNLAYDLFEQYQFRIKQYASFLLILNTRTHNFEAIFFWIPKATPAMIPPPSPGNKV